MRYLVFFVLLFQMPFCEAQEQPTEEQMKIIVLIREAFDRYQERNYDASLKAIGEVLTLEASRDMYSTYIFKGNIHFANRDFEAAKTAYLKSLELANNLDVDLTAAYVGISRSDARINSSSVANRSNTMSKDTLNKKTRPTRKTRQDTTVPFAIIEKVPVYPGCEESKSNRQLKACMQESITKLVAENFNTAAAKNLGVSGKVMISVQFKITKEGVVEVQAARSMHPLLEAEAIRVVELLPRMQPGTQRGKAVGVIYGLPIIFNVQP